MEINGRWIIKTNFWALKSCFLMSEQQPEEGSWIPFIIIVILLGARWLVYGQGGIPLKFRRFFNNQRVQIRRQAGYRDDSKYKTAAGQGADLQNKRQG